MRIRPEEEWLTIEVPAVFSDVEREALQKTLNQRGKPRKESGTYLLSHRFKSACGSGYHGNYNNGKARYLCNNRTTRKAKGGTDPMQKEVSRLEQGRLLSALLGGRLEADAEVIGHLAAEFVDSSTN